MSSSASSAEVFSAIVANDNEVVRRLVQANPGLLGRSGADGTAPIHCACRYANPEMLELLLALGDDLNRKEAQGLCCPIHFAAAFGKPGNVEFLLAKGIPVDTRGGNLNTPLHYAAREGHLDIARFLLAKGAEVDALCDDDSTPLSLAVREKRSEVADFLIGAGANVNKPNKKGATPLHYALYVGCAEIMESLLRAGADIEIRDVRGDTAVSIARKTGKPELARRLLEARGKGQEDANVGTMSSLLIKTALGKGIVKGEEIGFIPEAESVVRGGSDQVFQALKAKSKGKHTYDPDFVERCCCYLFGKAVEAVILWGQTKDGKFSIYYDPEQIIDMNLRAEVPERYVELVHAACSHGKILCDAHIDWCEQRLNGGTSEIDLEGEVKELFLMCSRLGMSYALENKYHELPGGDKGTVCHEPPNDSKVHFAAEEGMKYYRGQGVPKDLVKAVGHFTVAANGGHVGSQYGLAMMYFRGEGINQDSRMALQWFLKAAENGFAQAQHEVSVMLFNGVGCKPDTRKAFEWCQKAAEQNVLESIFNMGLFLINGNVVAQDPKKAVEYFKKAAALGHQGSKDALRQLGG